ncbi:FkbM family methyltransferase [Vineibacter terrae]|uniref:FkbM family methyltransferase n=1 Tax=Vineibacter terrae TaxID=2586908 RepID=UPI002E336C83|nr:FkbM family methyltransferase [Vineibacter terrae]HEX2890277.1 FkbM family methyltransferase [Vineibacter terrae]
MTDMEQSAREALLERLGRQAALYGAPLDVRLRRLPFRIFWPRALNVAGMTWRVTARTFFGRDMRVHLPDLAGKEIYQYGFFEEGLTRAIIEKLPAGGTFIDIGAYVGYYSLLASLLVGDEGRVVAFEPTPRTRAELSLNTSGFGNVQVVPLAAWDQPARLTLRDFGWRQSSFNSVLAPRVDGNPRCESIEVEAVAVDDWLLAHNIVPSFIKIDAESAEHRVLQGLRRTIEKHHPILSLEIGDYNLPGVPRSADLIRSLLAMGYDAWQYRGGTFVEHHVVDHYGFDNLIFTPRRQSMQTAAA